MIPVLGLWFTMSRVPRCRWVVAAVIVGIAVVAAVLLGWVVPRARLEIQLAAPPAGVLAVIGGRLVERRILGPARRAAPPYVLGICMVTTSFIVLWAGVPVTFHPDAGTVLPLPDGMRAAAVPHNDGACDSIGCVSTIDVIAADRSGDKMKAELTRHLRARGWGSGCRPTGWLLDGSTECVEISVRDGGATIRLSGNRENVREQTLSLR